jgi:hypothetical protein
MITFDTTNPTALLAAFKKGIDDGHVVTWSYDKDGDFTHTPQQWKGLAWLRPVVLRGQLGMKFIGPKGVTWEVFGVYQGRIIESMIVHCHDLFTTGTATAIPTASDTIAAA